MESANITSLDYYTAKAMLEWQVEFGVDEAISEQPVNRFEVKPEPKKAVKPVAAPAVEAGPAPVAPSVDGAALARDAAMSAQTVAELKTVLSGFEACELKRGARNLVFEDGVIGSRVMVIGEAPNRDEDREGKPFVGDMGLLLDNMLKAVGLGRSENVYVTSAIPWRLPRGGDVGADDLAMLRPFLERHVALAKPDVLVLMGNIACQAVLGKRGIARMRGQWAEAMGLPVIPMLHPEYLLNNPLKKRDAWADLLALKSKLEETT
ncbi:uracil-DNA glycosylase [Planktotalea sp.]|uniref:uracil-DNA glycosylase n=1 Tax=Planktotalea sp. TaxID=2029877 RepID=UPI003F6D9FB4